MATYNPNDAQAQLGQAFKQKFNRDWTQDEFGALAGYAGYTGGDVSQDQFTKAQEGIGKYSGNLSNPWATPSSEAPGVPGAPGSNRVGPMPLERPGVGPLPAQPASPTGGMMNPNDAMAQLNALFQGRFNRGLEGAEFDALKSYAGYTGGDVSQDQFSKAKEGIGKYSGTLSNPWGPALGTTTPTGAPPTPVDPTPQTNQLVQEQLQQLMTTGSTPALSEIDMNSPSMRAQRAAFQRANSKGTTRARLSAAERNAARGTLGAGGFDAELAGIENASGDREVDFESNLLRQELGGQRDRVMQALQMASATGNQGMTRQLQDRLAQLDAQIRREGLDVQKQGQKAQTGLGLLQTLLGNQRAQDALGFNYAQLGQNANMNSLMALLNGLG